MKTRRASAALGFGLVVLTGIWLFGTDIKTTGTEAPANIAPNESAASDAKAAQGASSAISADRSIVPLPPKDEPLAQILGSLQQRADRGDRKAACRLAMELLRCDEVAWWAELEANTGRDYETEYLKAGNAADAGAAAAAAGKAWQLERLLDCRAVPEGLTARGAHYLVQAARAGEPEAMLRYANGQFWRSDGRGMLSDPGFDAWRREAPGMLQRAFESGYPDAAFYMATARISDFGFLASLIEDDPEQALAAWYLHARLFGENGPLRHLGQDAATQQRARELAAQWHRTYFNDRTYRRPLMEAAYFMRPSQSESTAFCSDPVTQP